MDHENWRNTDFLAERLFNYRCFKKFLLQVSECASNNKIKEGEDLLLNIGIGSETLRTEAILENKFINERIKKAEILYFPIQTSGSFHSTFNGVFYWIGFAVVFSNSGLKLFRKPL